MIKSFCNKALVAVLVCSLVLGGCATGAKDADTDTSSESKSEVQTDDEEDTEEDDDKSDSGKSFKDSVNKKQSDKKGDGEDDYQKSSDTALPDIEYTYESIIDNSGGIVRVPDAKEGPKGIDMYQELATAELIKLDLEPLSEDASDEEIEELFKQMLQVGSYDYSALDEIQHFPYVIFKEDKIDPWTNRKVEEDMKVNIEIVLDASGSMAKEIDGVSMMNIAKDSITQVLSNMPENANVGLRVFGHLGDNTKANKEVSCGANELIHPITPLNIEGIQQALEPIQPTGWTSIAQSIENGVNDFAQLSDENTLNILFIITDGIETCGGDPEAAARQLKDSGTDIVLGIIGFNVDANQNNVLRSIAEAGGGHYATAKDAKNLTLELAAIYDMSFSNYKWITLDSELIDRLETDHNIALDFNRGIAENDAGHEKSLLNFLIDGGSDKANNDLMTSNKTIKSAGLYEAYGDVYDALTEMADEREAKITPLLLDRYEELEKQSKEYIEAIKAREGETVAYIPGTTRNDRIENILTNPGGSVDDYKQQGDDQKADQQESIDAMEEETSAE